MTSFFTFSWVFLTEMLKYSFLAAALLFLLSTMALLFVIFCPVKAGCSIRASMRGQRAAFYVAAFFGALKLEGRATALTQSIWIKLFGKKITLSSMEEDNELASEALEEKNKAEAESDSEVVKTQTFPSSEEKPSEKLKLNLTEDSFENIPSENSLYIQKDEAVKISADNLEEPSLEETLVDSLSETLTSESETNLDSSFVSNAISSEDLAQLEAFLDEEESHKTAKKEARRRFKKRMLKKIDKISNIINSVKRNYTLFKPVGKRFWKRGKQAFELEEAKLKLRYALGDPALTGICQGILAPAAGVLRNFNVRLVPVAVFQGESLYAKSELGVKIKPWRMLDALVRLVAEKPVFAVIKKRFL